MRPIKTALAAISRAVRSIGGVSVMAATQLPDPSPIKPPKGQSTFPGYRRQTAPSASALPRNDRRLANTDITSYRTSRSTAEAIRSFATASPDLSATVFSYLRVGIPEDYVVIARTRDGAVSPSGTALAQEILRRVTFMPDYQQGFNPLGSVHALACSLGKGFLYYGSASLEVALDAARMPAVFVPVHTPSLRFYEDGQGLKPVQVVGGDEIDLDIPTFIYTSIDQDLLDPYSSSPIEAALQPVLADQDFMNDLRRLLKKSIHPRVTATLIEEKLRKAAPLEAINDPAALQTYMESAIAAVVGVLETAAPEEALVGFDSVQYKYMDGDQGDVSANLKAVQDILNAKLATGAKTMPAALGHSQGGTHSSTEAILFVKNTNVIRLGVSELFSRALTISCRLLGEDVYVEFTYAPIDLRPSQELEAYRAMYQSRIIEQLSLGLITDEEASLLLTGKLPPPTMQPLSGTMFKHSKPEVGGNPNSQTSNMGKAKTPESPKSPSK